MATTRGCKGVIKIATVGVGELRSWEKNLEADEIDKTVMNPNCEKTFEAGSIAEGGTFECFWDPDDAGQNLLVIGTTVAVELFPGGEGTGLTLFSGSIVILGDDLGAEVNGMVERTITYRSSPPLTESVQP